MTRVKEAAKKCKKYMKKRDSDRINEAESMQQSLMESKRLAQKCITCLKSKDLSTHISNSKQLVEKMKKYKQTFQEGLDYINDSEGNPSQKFKSQIVG